MASHVILTAQADNLDACVIQRYPEDMDPIYQPAQGTLVGDKYPEALDFKMSPRVGGKLVTDCIRNHLGYLIVSALLRAALEESATAPIEFLPIHLVNHKGRRERQELFIANVLGQADCVDIQRSEYVEDAMTPGKFLYLKRLTLDPGRIDGARNIFRIASMPRIILVRDDLAGALARSGATGLAFLPLETPIDL